MKQMPKLFATLMLVFAGFFALNAQSLVKVSRVVTSSDDGLPMMGVAVMDGAGNGVITSLDGDYVIDVAPGTELTFSSIGFMDAKVVVRIMDESSPRGLRIFTQFLSSESSGRHNLSNIAGLVNV